MLSCEHAAAVCVLSFAALGMTSALANKHRVDHFEGRPSDTLQQAVDNLAEYNTRLAALLGQEGLSPSDLQDAHHLSYTLENALQKIDEELEGMAVTLEEMHLASESGDESGTVRHGRAYLDAANTLLRQQ